MPLARPFRRSCRGFTLIELLVTVAIIVLLVALLIPAFNAARRQAYAGNSAANLRQIAAALAMYKDVEGGLPGSYAALKLAHPQIVPVMHHLGDPVPEGVGNRYGPCMLRVPRLQVRSTYLSLLDVQPYIEQFDEQEVRYSFFVDMSFGENSRPGGRPWPPCLYCRSATCGGAMWWGRAIRAYPDTSVRVGRYGPVTVDGREVWSGQRYFSEDFQVRPRS
jgi:prepilin-type N-terminal cleavage/methylation domain-containing protein